MHFVGNKADIFTNVLPQPSLRCRGYSRKIRFFQVGQVPNSSNPLFSHFPNIPFRRFGNIEAFLLFVFLTLLLLLLLLSLFLLVAASIAPCVVERYARYIYRKRTKTFQVRKRPIAPVECVCFTKSPVCDRGERECNG